MASRSKAIDTLTFADGIATATISLGPRLPAISGGRDRWRQQPEYNGSSGDLTATTNFTYAVTARPSHPPRRRRVSAGRPAGWEKPFRRRRLPTAARTRSRRRTLLLIDNSLKTPDYGTTGWANG